MWIRVVFFFFKQKTAYEMCGRDWSSDVCYSDLGQVGLWFELEGEEAVVVVEVGQAVELWGVAW